MRMLFVADLHYELKQFDWLMAHAAEFDAVVIGGTSAGCVSKRACW